jgi:UDP-N-acetylglucosamine 1-carboxyvinyltransferase
MAKFIIHGGQPLYGEITVAGNKNAALPIIAATILTDDRCVINNIPNIVDVQVMLSILDDLGKKIKKLSEHSYEISGSIKKTTLNELLTKSLRASILFFGVILIKTGEISMVPPGGCVIGRRNVDSHFDVVTDFGAKIETKDKNYIAKLMKPKAAEIFLKEASVTATENAMLLAANIKGKTIINNAACEPHVVDLAQVLTKMGAKVLGAGTNRVEIEGKAKLEGFEHNVMPDHIEAGTFAIAAASTNGELIIHNAQKRHLTMVEHILRRLCVNLEFFDEDTLQIKPSGLVSQINKIQVGLWPGFPTDLMSPMIVLATQAMGITLCHDWMYESRMFFVDKLIAMGAQITQCDPHRVIVAGPTKLKAQELSSPDIRAGIALMIAALTARGTSEIDKVELIDRGYENIEQRLNNVGANILRK